MTGFVPLESLTGLFLFITLICALMGLLSPNVWTVNCQKIVSAERLIVSKIDTIAFYLDIVFLPVISDRLF